MCAELRDLIKVLELADDIVSDGRGETGCSRRNLSKDVRDEMINTGVGDDDGVETNTRTRCLAYLVSKLPGEYDCRDVWHSPSSR